MFAWTSTSLLLTCFLFKNFGYVAAAQGSAQHTIARVWSGAACLQSWQSGCVHPNIVGVVETGPNIFAVFAVLLDRAYASIHSVHNYYNWTLCIPTTTTTVEDRPVSTTTTSKIWPEYDLYGIHSSNLLACFDWSYLARVRISTMKQTWRAIIFQRLVNHTTLFTYLFVLTLCQQFRKDDHVQGPVNLIWGHL